MEERISNLIKKLTKDLADVSLIFIDKELEEKESTNDVFSLIVSAHISSLASLLFFITSDNEHDNELSRDLMREIENAIANHFLTKNLIKNNKEPL